MMRPPSDPEAYSILGIAYTTLKAKAAIRVGIAAARSNFPGWTTPSFKYPLRMEAPAGLGALAIKVSPPPVTAPDTRATLNSGLSPGTREAK